MVDNLFYRTRTAFVCSNGSVKVRFRVIIKVDKAKDKNPEVIATKVGRTLQVSVKNGRVGSLQVAPVVELKGKL